MFATETELVIELDCEAAKNQNNQNTIQNLIQNLKNKQKWNNNTSI